jgi:hypothetical protein
MKKSLFIVSVLILTTLLVSCGKKYESATASSYYVAHQGGYVGEATVSVDAKQNITAADWHEFQGPGGWAQYNSADGKSLVDGAIVRVPDPTANETSKDPQIKGYQFYIYAINGGVYNWLPYTPGKDGFTRPTRQFERNFEGLMSNPIRSAAYCQAAKDDTLVNVTIDGLNVTVGKKASETVHYGHMDKGNPQSTYMPLNGSSIGYRYNKKATLEFFKQNPTLDFSKAMTGKAKLSLLADTTVDAKANVASYTAASDTVWGVVDAWSGATFSDFPHYLIELQKAYQMALGKQLVKF